jgi:hypothetical protein
MNTTDTILSSEVLDRVWYKFLCYNGLAENNHKRYKWISRRTKISQDFENWLFTQGITVQQINGNRHLQVLDDQNATFFLLRWAQ